MLPRVFVSVRQLLTPSRVRPPALPGGEGGTKDSAPPGIGWNGGQRSAHDHLPPAGEFSAVTAQFAALLINYFNNFNLVLIILKVGLNKHCEAVTLDQLRRRFSFILTQSLTAAQAATTVKSCFYIILMVKYTIGTFYCI